MTGDTFTCAHCHGTFEKDWTDEEAATEALEVWGPLGTDDQTIVCDDCYQAMTSEVPPADFRARGPDA